MYEPYDFDEEALREQARLNDLDALVRDIRERQLSLGLTHERNVLVWLAGKLRELWEWLR